MALREIGVAHGDLLVRTDQEPAIRSIVEEAGRFLAAEGVGWYVVEQSQVGNSASNSLVERAILSVEEGSDVGHRVRRRRPLELDKVSLHWCALLRA